MSEYYIESYSENELRYGFITVQGLFTPYYTKIPIDKCQNILTALRGNDISELKLFKYTGTALIRSYIVNWEYGMKYNPMESLLPNSLLVDTDWLTTLSINILEFNAIDIINGKHFLEHISDGVDCLIMLLERTKSLCFNRDIYYLRALRRALFVFRCIDYESEDVELNIRTGIYQLLILHPYCMPLLNIQNDRLLSSAIYHELTTHKMSNQFFDTLSKIIVDDDAFKGVM